MSGLDPNSPSSGISRPDHGTLKLRAANTDVMSLTPAAVTLDASVITLTAPGVDGSAIVLNGDLSGTGIDNLLGGLGAPEGAGDLAIASPYASDSFSVADGNFRLHGKRLELTTTQRVTLEGSARLILI